MATATIETGDVPAIYGAMHKVMQGIANVPKSGQMKFGNTSYDYLRADDVQEKLNPLLTENNIVVSAEYDVRDTEKGNRAWLYVDLTLTYISTVDGSKFPPVRATGESIAGDDKSVNKALTQAIKNAHRATFQFASGEPEPDDAPPSATPAVKPAQAKVDQARNKGNPPNRVVNSEYKTKLNDEYIVTGKFTAETLGKRFEKVQAANAGKNRAEVYELLYKELEAENAGA